MAGTIIADSPLITRLEGQSLGYVGATLSNFDSDLEPQIIGNFEIAGSIGSFASLESITGWAALANGTAYIKIVPDTTAGTCTAEFTATAPTWDNAKMGWYGTGANANHRYLFKLTKGGASLWTDKSFLEVQGKYQNVTVENDLTVEGLIDVGGISFGNSRQVITSSPGFILWNNGFVANYTISDPGIYIVTYSDTNFGRNGLRITYDRDMWYAPSATMGHSQEGVQTGIVIVIDGFPVTISADTEMMPVPQDVIRLGVVKIG